MERPLHFSVKNIVPSGLTFMSQGLSRPSSTGVTLITGTFIPAATATEPPITNAEATEATNDCLIRCFIKAPSLLFLLIFCVFQVHRKIFDFFVG